MGQRRMSEVGFVSRGPAQAEAPADPVAADPISAELNAYRAALEELAIVAITDRTGRITYVNQQFCEISKYPQEELIGRTHAIVNSGYQPRGFFAEMWRTIAHGRRWRGEICNRARDGSLYWVDTTIVPLLGENQRIDGYVSVRFDVTARKHAEMSVEDEVKHRRNAETLLRDVLETVPDAIAAFDSSDRLQFFNSAYRKFYPRLSEAMIEGALFEDLLRLGVERGQFVLPDNPELRRQWIGTRVEAHLHPGKAFTQQLAGGRWLQVQERRSATGHLVGVGTDVTALKTAEKELRLQSQRDPLTGLFNRAVLLERLTRQMARAKSSGRQSALLLLDLDGFKDINDTRGHEFGDRLLVAVAQRLKGALRATDTIVRLGGDEFAAILPKLSDDAALERLVSRVTTALRELLVFEGVAVQPSTSIGISVFPRDARDPRELLKCADVALYHAKAQGRDRHAYFDASLRRDAEKKKVMASRLARALDGDGLHIALQPQFDITSGRHCGFEALARWTDRGVEINPADFIPVAEETGLIVRLGRLVMEKAVREAARLLKAGFDPGTIAVNVAAGQLKLEDFPDQVSQCLAAHGLPPGRLEIELTENVLLDRSGDRVARSLERLHELGVQISLDDFGTGHASLAHLKRFPVDRLKIDKSFVWGIGQSVQDEIIVRTVVGLAHNLGMKVVAEGIDSPCQLDFLREIGCDIGQGYLNSRPLPLADAGDFLSREPTIGPAPVRLENDEAAPSPGVKTQRPGPATRAKRRTAVRKRTRKQTTGEGTQT